MSISQLKNASNSVIKNMRLNILAMQFKKHKKTFLKLGLIEFQLVLSLIAQELLTLVYYLDNSACAAASLATGTRKGEQDT